MANVDKLIKMFLDSFLIKNKPFATKSGFPSDYVFSRQNIRYRNFRNFWRHRIDASENIVGGAVRSAASAEAGSTNHQQSWTSAARLLSDYGRHDPPVYQIYLVVHDHRK